MTIANDQRFWNTVSMLKRLSDNDEVPGPIQRKAFNLYRWMEDYAEVHFNG